MKNGSPEELDFTYDDDFAVFACGASRRKHFRRKERPLRKPVRANRGRRSGK
jgi:hypothetical protein